MKRLEPPERGALLRRRGRARRPDGPRGLGRVGPERVEHQLPLRRARDAAVHGAERRPLARRRGLDAQGPRRRTRAVLRHVGHVQRTRPDRARHGERLHPARRAAGGGGPRRARGRARAPARQRGRGRNHGKCGASASSSRTPTNGRWRASSAAPRVRCGASSRSTRSSPRSSRSCAIRRRARAGSEGSRNAAPRHDAPPPGVDLAAPPRARARPVLRGRLRRARAGAGPGIPASGRRRVVSERSAATRRGVLATDPRAGGSRHLDGLRVPHHQTTRSTRSASTDSRSSSATTSGSRTGCSERCCRAKGNYKAASLLLQRAIGIRPTNIKHVYDHLDHVLYLLDRYQEAIEIADRGIAMARKQIVRVPDDQDARVHMATLLARMGLRDEALDLLAKAQEASVRKTASTGFPRRHGAGDPRKPDRGARGAGSRRTRAATSCAPSTAIPSSIRSARHGAVPGARRVARIRSQDDNGAPDSSESGPRLFDSSAEEALVRRGPDSEESGAFGPDSVSAPRPC